MALRAIFSLNKERNLCRIIELLNLYGINKTREIFKGQFLY